MESCSIKIYKKSLLLICLLHLSFSKNISNLSFRLYFQADFCDKEDWLFLNFSKHLHSCFSYVQIYCKAYLTSKYLKNTSFIDYPILKDHKPFANENRINFHSLIILKKIIRSIGEAWILKSFFYLHEATNPKFKFFYHLLLGLWIFSNSIFNTNRYSFRRLDKVQFLITANWRTDQKASQNRCGKVKEWLSPSADYFQPFNL